MLKNTVISFDRNGMGPYMAQVASVVVSPSGSGENSTIL